MTWKPLLGKAGLLLGLAAGCGPGAGLESRGDIAFLNHCAPCHLPDGHDADDGDTRQGRALVLLHSSHQGQAEALSP